jgi:hypothetical protein
MKEKLSFSGLIVFLFAGLLSGAGLWQLYLAARYCLILLGVQFNSM